MAGGMDPKLDQRRPISERLGWDRQPAPAPRPAPAGGRAPQGPDHPRPERARPEHEHRDRVQQGTPARPRRAGPAVEDDAPRTMPRGGRPVHVWVCDIPEAPGTHPGVLLGWQQDGAGRWLGRVMMAAEGREGWVTMTLWVDARNLRSLDARP